MTINFSICEIESMLKSDLMRAVVREHLPQGLPTDEGLEEMSVGELEKLLSQQTAIIEVFRREATANIARLRVQMDSLQSQAPADAAVPIDAGMAIASGATMRLPAAMATVHRQKLAVIHPKPSNPFLERPAVAPPRRPPFRQFIFPRRHKGL
jgi:hypothetical protein